MHSRQLQVLLLARVSENLDSALALLQVSLQLLYPQLEAPDVKVSSVDCFLQTLNVPVALLGVGGGITQVGLETLDVSLLLVVAVFHHPDFSSQLGVLLVLDGQLLVSILYV